MKQRNVQEAMRRAQLVIESEVANSERTWKLTRGCVAAPESTPRPNSMFTSTKNGDKIY